MDQLTNDLIQDMLFLTINDRNESFVDSIMDFLEKARKIMLKTSPNYIDANELIKIVSATETQGSELCVQSVQKEEILYILQKNKIFVMVEDRVKAVFDYVVYLYVKCENEKKNLIAKLLYKLKMYIVTFLQSPEINKHIIVNYIKEYINDILFREKKQEIDDKEEKDFTAYVIFVTLELFLQYCDVNKLSDIITKSFAQINDKIEKIMDGTLDTTDAEFTELLHRFTMILKNLPFENLQTLKSWDCNANIVCTAFVQNLMKLKPEGPLMKYEINVIVKKLTCD